MSTVVRSKYALRAAAPPVAVAPVPNGVSCPCQSETSSSWIVTGAEFFWPVIPLAFLVIQGVYIARHLEPETPKS